MAQRAVVPSTGHGAGAGVDTDLHAHGVDFVCDVLDAVRELDWVGDKISRGVAACRPAVIHDDIVVSEIPEAEGDDFVCSIQDDLFVHVAAERVPGVLEK